LIECLRKEEENNRRRKQQKKKTKEEETNESVHGTYSIPDAAPPHKKNKQENIETK
jgi:hypothetical protein